MIALQNHIQAAFTSMENLTWFLDGCRKLGLRDTQLFTAQDAFGANEIVPKGVDEETANLMIQKEKDRRLRDVCAVVYDVAPQANT
jgi:hypothetical protein